MGGRVLGVLFSHKLPWTGPRREWGNFLRNHVGPGGVRKEVCGTGRKGESMEFIGH